MNYDELMINALDGTITPSDKVALDAYFAQRPDARAMFEQMVAVDFALKEAEPTAPPPAGFTQQVMARVHVTPIVKPMARRHVAAIVVGNSVVVSITWLMSLAVLAGLALLVSKVRILQPVFALGRALAIGGADVARAMTSVLHAMIAQPLAWVIFIAVLGMVATWLAFIARVWLPQRRLAFMQP